MTYSWIKTLPRDAGMFYRMGKATMLLRAQQRKNETVGSVFDALAKRVPGKACFYHNDKVWTYGEVEAESNRIGNYFLQQGFVKGDVVSLFMSNRLELVTTWLGLSKIGVVSALVNSSLTHDMLKRSIEVVKPKGIICGYELSEVLDGVYPRGESSVPVFCAGVGDRGLLSRATDLDKDILQTGAQTPVPKIPVDYGDDLMYIYTSGTTGLPKAAIIKQSRYLTISFGMHTFVGMKKGDVMYTTLPLQHSFGGIVAVGYALCNSVPLAFRSKFSATEFWKDCIKYNVTVAQYIGEICRYLLKHPVTPEETQHSLRAMSGIGLRPEVWAHFQNRFKVPLIQEMYGSTEGNCQIFNIHGHPGAIGFIPPLLRKRFPVTLIKLNEEDQPIRDPKTGLVVQSEIGEPGEIVGQIVAGEPRRDYKGYAGDAVASKRNVLESVLKPGDKFFRSGDLCVRDDLGYIYFQDRIGDSIRFKGENVSASEVEDVINKITKSRHEVIVFGVKVPNVDGSVAMAVIADPLKILDVHSITKELLENLPHFAQPHFIKIVSTIEDTVTYKLKKTDFKKYGYDVEKLNPGDKLYILLEKKFEPLTLEMFKKLKAGELTLRK